MRLKGLSGGLRDGQGAARNGNSIAGTSHRQRPGSGGGWSTCLPRSAGGQNGCGLHVHLLTHKMGPVDGSWLVSIPWHSPAGTLPPLPPILPGTRVPPTP